MPTPARLPFLCATAACLLVACGGGGGGTSPTTAVTVPLEGFYQGTNSNKETVQTLVLENGDFWGVVIPAGTSRPNAILQGAGNSSANLVQNTNIFTVPSLLQINNAQTTATGSITASYVPRSSVLGTTTLNNGSSYTFNQALVAGNTFNYDLPAIVASLAGAWSGIAFDGSTSVLTIDGAARTFSIPAGVCTLSGALTARATGKNVYDVAAQYTTTATTNTVAGTPVAVCANAGLAVKGFALNYNLTAGKQLIVLVTLDADRTVASYFTASR